MMNKNSEMIAKIAVAPSKEAVRAADVRRKNRAWSKKSSQIALAVHYYLEQMNMSQKGLAEKMGVSPSYVARLLKGEENLSLETITKIEVVLGVELIIVDRPYVSVEKVTNSVLANRNRRKGYVISLMNNSIVNVVKEYGDYVADKSDNVA